LKGGRLLALVIDPRWVNEGIFFSSMKNMFGEHVSARRKANMIKALMIKASLYDAFIGMR
jgi:hypothetical protein